MILQMLFRRSNDTKFHYSVLGESNDVDQAVVEEFRSNFESYVDGFRPENIFNADECGLFFKALPNRSLVIKGDKCKSGKQSKVRVSILLAASATGEKLKPFVIGKSMKPRCFKNIKTKDLPVTYTANKKAWMTSKLFEDWVASVNEEMEKKNRSILLVVDNCPAHPEIPEMSNLTLKFLPPNTTSELQPMDRGIIKNFKMFYRKLLLRMVVSKSDVDGQSASVIANAVTVLDAIKWISEAWNCVTDCTIKNCFRKAGFDFSETSMGTETAENEIEVPPSPTTIEIDGVSYDFEEFVNCDDDIAFTQIFDDKTLRKAVLEEATSSDFDEEDLIPLSELRLRISSISTNDLGHDSDQSELCDITEREHSISPTSADLAHVSKMLDEILIFATEKMPNMIDPINLCQKYVAEKMCKPT